MKKVLPGILVVVVVVIAAAAFVFWKKAIVAHSRAAELVPADTLFFVQLPDLKRTAWRWPQTGLAKILAEPEVQEFLAKPQANAPQMKLWQEKFAQIARLLPGEAFLAVTSIDGPTPRFIAGFSYLGRKKDAQALLAQPREALRSAWPAGKADVVMHGKTAIETFSFQEKTVAEAFEGNWFFVANDLELLRRTVDAVPRGLGATALAAQSPFKTAMAKLPADGEALAFAQVGVLSERLVSLLVASGQTLDPKQIAELKKVQALAWGTKFEGSQTRDSLFLLSPGQAAEPALARNSLALTSAQTFLTYATKLPTTFEMPSSSMALGAIVPGFAGLEQTLAEKGLKWSDLSAAFGPEFGLVGNWEENSGQPSVLFAFDVRDSALAMRFTEVFTGGLAGMPAWGSKQEPGVTVFQSAAAPGLIAITPTVALTDKFLILGLSSAEIAGALGQLATGQAAIASSPTFSQSESAVGEATGGFGYLDLRRLFERSYGVLRPFIGMSLAFSPEAGKYLDGGKLPSTAAISKHLTPSVYSQSVATEGTLIESVGTLTFNQVVLVTVGGAAAAAFPMIESALAGGLNLDPGIFQMKPPGQPGADSPPSGQTPPATEPALVLPEVPENTPQL